MVIALGGEKVDNEKEIVESVKEDIFEEPQYRPKQHPFFDLLNSKVILNDNTFLPSVLVF